MKKAISMMLATAMAATCLAGCGSAASSGAAASSEAASSEATSAATSEASTGEKTFENNELNIAVFEGGYGSAYWDEIIKRFEDAYPGVTVNMQISPKIGDIIRPQIVAGNVPDFISMNDNDSTGLISSMVKEHALMDLSDVFEEGGIDDDTPLKDQVIDGLLDSAKCSPYGDGKIYIAPFDASPMGLVYNKTLFEENGWETPVTWDDFFELGDKAKEKGIALFTYQGIYPGYLESMLWPALASATGIDNMKAIASYTPGSLSSDEALKVFQNMAKIGTDGYLMDGTVALNHTQSQTDMMMNKALFIPNGNWMEGEMADAPRADGFEFGLTCAPVLDDGETRYVMSSVEQFEIPANAKNPELAKEFLRFLYTEDSVKLFAEKANGIYALKKANEMVKGIVTDGVYNMNDIYQLADYPAHTLYETIPHFHDTPKRFADFQRAVVEDRMGRVAQVQREIEFVRAREADYHVMVDLLAAGKLPLRVTHNDTKLNNILFDKTTGEGLCVIDLDTVMPGLAANDFGDSIRFGANHCAEDEADLSKVNFSMELFEIYTKGFLQAAGEAFTPLEKQTLPWGAKLMTMECGMRFLADYLEGDHYFHINYETQNLNRARTQFKLTADMEQNWDAMQKVIEKYC